MVIGFNKQFVDAIVIGNKKHTIREDKTNRWKPGMKMHMATGVRTKNYNQFFEATVVSTQEIEIVKHESFHGFGKVYIDGVLIKQFSGVSKLARNDGFKTRFHFFKFFNTKSFKGKIIHWTDLKY